MSELRFVNLYFSNSSGSTKYVSVEPAGESIELDADSEFWMQAREDNYHIEYLSESQFNIFFEKEFDFRLYKRPLKTPAEWILELDLINEP